MAKQHDGNPQKNVATYSLNVNAERGWENSIHKATSHCNLTYNILKLLIIMSKSLNHSVCMI